MPTTFLRSKLEPVLQFFRQEVPELENAFLAQIEAIIRLVAEQKRVPLAEAARMVADSRRFQILQQSPECALIILRQSPEHWAQQMTA